MAQTSHFQNPCVQHTAKPTATGLRPPGEERGNVHPERQHVRRHDAVELQLLALHTIHTCSISHGSSCAVFTLRNADTVCAASS